MIVPEMGRSCMIFRATHFGEGELEAAGRICQEVIRNA